MAVMGHWPNLRHHTRYKKLILIMEQWISNTNLSIGIFGECNSNINQLLKNAPGPIFILFHSILRICFDE